MKSVRMIVLGAALGIVSQAALAFQETNGSAPAAAAAGSSGQLNAPASVGAAKGPEIRVPGLGTVGALPKLDFGLELLYGATSAPVTQHEDKSDSGAQIRGTLKYRFPN